MGARAPGAVSRRSHGELTANVAFPPGRMPLFFRGRPLKRWRYVACFSEELMLCAAAVSIGPLRQRFWAVWDRHGQTLRGATRLLRLGVVSLAPASLRIADGDVQVRLALSEGPGVQTIWPDGAGYVWTRKQAGVKASGAVLLDGQRVDFAGRAVIDDTAGYHRRETSWRWSAGVGERSDGTQLAWNVVAGVNDPPLLSERTLWVDGKPLELPPASFASDLSSFAFGAAGISFAAEAARSHSQNLLIMRSAYEAPFGTFHGDFPDGVELAHGLGVMERHDVRW